MAHFILSPIKKLAAFILFAGIAQFLFIPQVKADVPGAEITYKCTTTPGIVEVTLIFYRKCAGLPLCGGTCGTPCTNTIQMTGNDGSFAGTNFGNIIVSLVSLRDVGYNPACPNSKNACTNMGCVTAGPFTVSYERYEFKGFANVGPTSAIPSACCNIRFSYTECCREGIIATGQAYQNIYVFAMMNRCVALAPQPCNSSPIFLNDPVMWACGGENVVYNDGAFDEDGDSLSFAFAPALQSFGNPVTYTAPFRFDRPMPWTGAGSAPFPAGISCDPFNGQIMFTPGNTSGQNFTGTMCIEVKQWKTIDGVRQLMGLVRRDHLMVILANCPPNNPPRITTIPASPINPYAPKLDWEVIEGQQLCFTVEASDTDFIPPLISDTTSLEWNNTLGSLGATFGKNYPHSAADRKLFGPREDEWKFCWTPALGSARSLPYQFSIKAKDKRCPNPGKVERGFSIRVLDALKASIVQTQVSGNSWRVRYQKTIPTQVFTKTTITVSKVPNIFPLIPSLTDSFVNMQQTPDITFSQPGKYLVKLRVIGAGFPAELIVYDTIVQKVCSVNSIFVKDTSVCPNNAFNITPVITAANNRNFYYWYLSRDGITPINSDSTLKDLPYYAINNGPSIEQRFLKVIDSVGCVFWKTVNIGIRKKPEIPLPVSTQICKGNAALLDAGTNGGNIANYQWSTGAFTRTITVMDSGLFSVTVTDTTGCLYTNTTSVKVENRPNIGAIQGNIKVPDKSKEYAYGVAPKSNHTYDWGVSNGSIIAGLNTNQVQVKWDKVGKGTLTLKLTNNNGNCFDTTSLLVTIDSLINPPIGIAPLKTTAFLFDIFPNPTDGQFTVQFKTNHQGLAHIECYNILGQSVYENDLLVNAGENKINISTKLQPGIYLVKLMVDNKTSVKQISIR